MSSRRSTTHLGSKAGNFLQWLLGTGFLKLNAAIFGIAAVSLVAWNLIADPSDLWVDDSLKKWGFILFLQAILVAAIAVARWLFAWGDPDAITSNAHAPTASWPIAQTSSSSLAHSVEPSRVAMAESWARKWLEAQDEVSLVDSETPQQDAPVPFSVMQITTAEPAPMVRDASSYWPEPGTVPPASSAEPHDPEPVVVSRGIDPLRIDFPSATNADFDADWQWVEAAANAWLARRYDDPTPPPTNLPAGKPAKGVS